MQGIRTAELKILLDYLQTLKETGSYHLPQDHLALINEKEKELKKIYANYQFLLKQVSEYVQLFETEKHAVRGFLKKNKHYLKVDKRVNGRLKE